MLLSQPSKQRICEGSRFFLKPAFWGLLFVHKKREKLLRQQHRQKLIIIERSLPNNALSQQQHNINEKQR